MRDADPNEAARIANSLRTFAAQKIVEVTKVSDVTTLEEAVPREEPTTPNTKRNILLGLLAGVSWQRELSWLWKFWMTA